MRVEWVFKHLCERALISYEAGENLGKTNRRIFVNSIIDCNGIYDISKVIDTS